jgi:CYTH domain-containing protein
VFFNKKIESEVISVEIERKFLIDKEQLPVDLERYPHSDLEQGYIITEPVLRIRKKNDAYILTYKGAGFLQREEVEFPLTREAYDKLLTKVEGNIITKTRYKIPEKIDLTIELDIFSGLFQGLYLAEVEFPDEETANAYLPPAWFGREVTYESTFHNSTLSKMEVSDVDKMLREL